MPKGMHSIQLHCNLGPYTGADMHGLLHRFKQLRKRQGVIAARVFLTTDWLRDTRTTTGKKVSSWKQVRNAFYEAASNDGAQQVLCYSRKPTHPKKPKEPRRFFHPEFGGGNYDPKPRFRQMHNNFLAFRVQAQCEVVVSVIIAITMEPVQHVVRETMLLVSTLYESMGEPRCEVLMYFRSPLIPWGCRHQHADARGLPSWLSTTPLVVQLFEAMG